VVTLTNASVFAL